MDSGIREVIDRGRGTWLRLAMAVLCLLTACQRGQPTQAAPTASPTASVDRATITPVPTATLAVTPTMTATETPTAAPSPTPASTPTAVPTPVGGGGLIAVSARIENNWDLYAIDPVTKRRTRLTADPAQDRDPSFSANGEMLAFSSRRDGYWNLYTLNREGVVDRVTDHPAYDGAPAWSPQGDRIAFESMRDGDLDVWLLDLDGGTLVNLTVDSPHVDSGPVWAPGGDRIAFTSWRYGDADIFVLDLTSGDVEQVTSLPVEERVAAWNREDELLYVRTEGEGQEIYCRPVDASSDTDGEWLTRRQYVHAPAWSPDGQQVAFLYRYTHGARLYVEQRGALPIRLTDELALAGPLAWTSARAAWREASGEPVIFYVEQTHPGEGTLYDLQPLDGIDVGNPWLSDRVDDSFWALRDRIIQETGHDFLAQLSDAWRGVSYYSAGSAYMSWHKAGRAIDTLLDYLSPDRRQRWLELVIEPGGGEVYWRLYLRCAAQDGSQGAPLRVRPWDITAAARQNGRGGQRKPIPNGYYVDLTDLMAQYGWLRIASHDHPDFHWYRNLLAVEYWHFQKTEGLLWYDAMLELFEPEVVEMHHNWDVQQLKGTPLWLAAVKGVPLPPRERQLLDMIAR